jgi:hypothetical protein
MATSDLNALSDRVRLAAVVLSNGEVLWPYENVADAINELADRGHVVLGLDARERSGEGLVTEIPLSDCRSTEVEIARREALAALDRAESITGWVRPNILIAW